MELRDLWESTVNATPQKEIKLTDLKGRDSKHPLVILLKHLRVNQILSYVIVAFYFSLLFFIEDWYIRIPLFVVVAFMAWLTIATQRIGKKIRIEITAEKSIISELKLVLEQFEEWLDFSSKAALFIYPLSITAGFLFGGINAANITVEELMSQTFIQWALVITILIFTPLSHFFAKWANNWAFGKHITHIKDLIRQIEDNSNS